MSKREISIAFIGAGSIGSLFGGYLASKIYEKYSLKVIFFLRGAQFDTIKKQGLILLKQGSEVVLENIGLFRNVDDFENQNSFIFDYIFITTKAYDLKTVMDQYKKVIHECKNLVILQNGLGNEDIAGKSIEKGKIIRGITTNGALIEKTGKVIHTGIGITKLGFPFKHEKLSPLSKEQLHILKDILNISGLETIIVDDIIKECWEKIFVNIGINAIGALTRLKNGELLEDEGLKSLMAYAIKEALIIAEKRGINLDKKDFVSLTYEIAEKTYHNKNSMLQDILKGKKTEINFINKGFREFKRIKKSLLFI